MKSLRVIVAGLLFVCTASQSMELPPHSSEDNLILNEDARIQALIVLCARHNIPFEVLRIIADFIDPLFAIQLFFESSPIGSHTIRRAIEHGSLAQTQWLLLTGSDPEDRIQVGPYGSESTLLEIAHTRLHFTVEPNLRARRSIIIRLLKRALRFIENKTNVHINEAFLKSLGIFKITP